MTRAFNWAEKSGHIERSRIRHAEKPTPDKREHHVSPDEHALVLGRVCDQDFRDLLTLAWETGARPQELFRVAARHVDLANARWVFPKDESKGKKQSRTVYLSDIELEITQRAMSKWPEGLLLRNRDGEPWCAFSTNCRFRRLTKHVGHKFCLYSWRHGYAHRMLSQEVDSFALDGLWAPDEEPKVAPRDGSQVVELIGSSEHRD